MKQPQSLKKFTDRYPLLGPGIWIFNVQYFIVQLVVALPFKPHYSLMHNTISDLGNTACGLYRNKYVCSPEHGLMNVSFILLGFAMTIGSGLIYQKLKKNTGSIVCFSAIAFAGIGTILVGLFPENTIRLLHGTGAEIVFIVGNIALVVAGINFKFPKFLRIYTLLSGVIGFIALALYVTHNYLDLGVGGMERLVAYPQTIWTIVIGIYISANIISERTGRSVN